MMFGEELNPRQISDNEFQKVPWANHRHRLKFDPPRVYDYSVYIDWILENTYGLWHYKENFKGSVHNVCFWFELEEDILYFKLAHL